MCSQNAYVTHKLVPAAQGVKITGKDLEKALAGFPVFVAEKPDEVEVFKVSEFVCGCFKLCWCSLIRKKQLNR